VSAVLCVAAGAAALLIGYFGVSGTLDTAEQIPYVVSGGMAGLFLLGLGALLWLSADLRDEWRKLDAIDRRRPGLSPESATAQPLESPAEHPATVR
jgi:hypothetical protein